MYLHNKQKISTKSYERSMYERKLFNKNKRNTNVIYNNIYNNKSKVKLGYLYNGTVSLTATGGCRFARPQCLAATHLSSPEVGNGLS